MMWNPYFVEHYVREKQRELLAAAGWRPRGLKKPCPRRPDYAPGATTRTRVPAPGELLTSSVPENLSTLSRIPRRPSPPPLRA